MEADVRQLAELSRRPYALCLQSVSMYTDVDVAALIGSSMDQSLRRYHGGASMWHDLALRCVHFRPSRRRACQRGGPGRENVQLLRRYTWGGRLGCIGTCGGELHGSLRAVCDVIATDAPASTGGEYGGFLGLGFGTDLGTQPLHVTVNGSASCIPWRALFIACMIQHT